MAFGDIRFTYFIPNLYNTHMKSMELEGIDLDLPDIFQLIQGNHGLTQTRVCTILEYSSRTQLQRILKKQVSDKLMTDFGERLLAHSEELELTSDEIISIQRCLFFPSTKKPDYNYAASLFSTISSSELASQQKELHVQSVLGVPIPHFQQYLLDASRVRIEIIGCDMLFMRDTLEMLSAQCNLTVEHYYLENQSPLYTIHLLSTFWNFFHKPWFFPYSVKAKSSCFLPSISLLSMDIEFKDGQKKSYFIFPRESDNLIAIPVPSQHQRISSLLFSEKANIKPMKISNSVTQDYAHYLNYVKDLEHNHRLFRIKADLGLEFIPADIQLAAVREGPMRDYPAEDMTILLDQLYEIENARYLNSLNKHLHQYHLLSYEAMLNFARTGMLSDHFWGFRAFTPQERLFILKDFYNRACTSRYFHFSFLNSNVHLVWDELIWYEHVGVCFLPPRTHYDIDDDHSEFILSDPVFCDFFSNFFRPWLFEHYALPLSESKERFQDLINICEQQCSASVPPPEKNDQLFENKGVDCLSKTLWFKAAN